MELLDKLGINWKLLIAQIVNFIILFAILSKFVFDPVMKFLRERSDKIAKSLDEAKAIDERMQKTERERAEVLGKARTESGAIIAEAKRAVEALHTDAVAKGRETVQAMIIAAKSAIASERATALAAARAEIADLVITVSEKILGEEVSPKWEKKKVDELVAAARSR